MFTANLSFEGVEFRVAINPAKHVINSETYLRAFLLIKCVDDVSVDVKFSCQKLTGQQMLKEVKSFSEKIETKFGWNDTGTFVKRSELSYSPFMHTHEYTPGDKLKFLVEFHFKPRIAPKVPIQPFLITNIPWNKEISNYLGCRNTSDIILVATDTHIPCHKLILSIASPVFKAMFENQM